MQRGDLKRAQGLQFPVLLFGLSSSAVCAGAVGVISREGKALLRCASAEGWAQPT